MGILSSAAGRPSPLPSSCLFFFPNPSCGCHRAHGHLLPLVWLRLREALSLGPQNHFGPGCCSGVLWDSSLICQCVLQALEAYLVLSKWLPPLLLLHQ
uniref:Uncharacterized protein n=1 Tax=Junco hyemalis TaxID=40217 RepID=A0A8C5JLJ1_JUNHY